MISPEDLYALDTAEGVQAARTYLTLMIEHHEGAIETGADTLPTLANSWTISFARHIVNEQTIEVDGMRRMLDDLPPQRP